MTERTIFLAALDITDPKGRTEYLNGTCGHNLALRNKVEALLAAHQREGSFLDVPAVEQIGANPDDTHAGETNDPCDLLFLGPANKPGVLGRLGHYEVLEIAGKGGMGIVLRAYDEKLHRLVAIKVLAPHLATTGSARQRFVREAQAAASVVHDNVIAIHAVEDGGPAPYLVMQFIDGRTLQDKLDRSGPPSLKEILRIGYQMALGLAAAHKQGLIHRDIKPANILLENGVERVKITDFGLARAADDARLTQSGAIAGTPLYMAPEQAEGKAVDQRSDLFSLGSVLYAMCTGHPPFRASNPLAILKRICEDTPRSIRAINPEIPEWLEAIVSRLLAKDPAKRFQTAAEVAELLSEHLAQVQQPNRSPVPRIQTRRAPRWPLAVGGAAAVVAMFIALAGYVANRTRISNETPEPPARTPVDLATLPSPFDDRPPLSGAWGALAGGCNPALAPPDVVALLGDPAFRLVPGDLSHPDCSPDGRLLAVACGRHVRIFDAKSAALLRTFDSQDRRAMRVRFSPDSTQLLVPGWDGIARLFDVASGKLVRVFKGHVGPVVVGIFAAGGDTVVTGGVDGTARAFETQSGYQSRRLNHPGHVHALAVSADGSRLVTGCTDRQVRVWDLGNGSLQKTLTGHRTELGTVQFSPDGKLLGSGANSEFRLWDAATFAHLRTVDTGAGWFRFTPDSARVWCGRIDYGPRQPHAVTCWDANSGEKKAEFPLVGDGEYAVYALAPDGNTVFHSRVDSVGLRLRAYDSKTGAERFPSRGHTGKVLAVAVSPDGRWVATGGADRTVRLWNLGTWAKDAPQPSIRVFTGHADAITALQFSPDGTVLAAAGNDRMITLWDIASGKETQTIPGPAEPQALVRFHPHGSTLAVGMDDGTIRLWDLVTGTAKDSLRWHAGRVRAIAFSADGRWLASGGEDNTIQLYDSDAGRRLHTFRSRGPVHAMAFAPDGRSLVADSGPEHVLRIWDIESRKELSSSPHATPITALVMHPAGKVVGAMNNGAAVLWDIHGGLAQQRALSVGIGAGPVHALAFTPEGRYLATANDNGTASIVRVQAEPRAYQPGGARQLPDCSRPVPADALQPENIPAEVLARAGEPVEKPAELVAVLGNQRLRHNAAAVALRFIDDDKTLVSLGKDRAVRFWDVATGQERRNVPVETGEFTGYAISPDARTLAIGYDATGTVKLWDLDTGKLTHTLANAADRGVLTPGIAFSPDSKTMVTGGRWYWCKLWDVAEAKTRHKLERRNCNMYCFAFSPDGNTVAVGYEDPVVVIWDVNTGKSLHDLTTIARGTSEVALSADGKMVAGGIWNGMCQVWDTTTGKELARIRAHTNYPSALTFNPDGKMLATASPDRTIKLWELPTGKPLRALPPQRDTVFSLAFTADGKSLASASGDGLVRIWNVETGEDRLPSRGHTAPVRAAAVSADGKVLASAGEDRLVILWDLAHGRVAHVLSGHTEAVASVALSPDGATVASIADDGTLRLWDALKGKQKGVAVECASKLVHVAFAPDGRSFATASLDGCARLWDAASGKLVRVYPHDTPNVWSVAFSPDGKLLATGAGDHTVRLWDVATGWTIAALKGHTSAARAVAFHPDGTTLASSSDDGAIRLWDAATLQSRQVLKGFQGEWSNLAWSADGRRLGIFAHRGGSVQLIEPADPTRVQPLKLASGRRALALTPEGRHLVAATPDGPLQIMRVARHRQETPAGPKD